MTGNCGWLVVAGLVRYATVRTEGHTDRVADGKGLLL